MAEPERDLGEVRAKSCTTSSTGCARSTRSWRSNPARAAAAGSISAILQRVDEVWTSDNTEAFDRLRIQEGFSQAYAPKVMMAWVTDVPNMNGRSTPLKYRFLVAMQGALGIGANLNKWTPDDDSLATKMIALYKQIRGTVQDGNLYRLLSPREGDLTANQYVSQDGKQAVLFAFLHSQQYREKAPAIRSGRARPQGGLPGGDYGSGAEPRPASERRLPDGDRTRSAVGGRL